MSRAYYNEIDKYAAQWLRNLIAAGHIAPGDVDERSIEDVKPSDLAGYTQCHFFAGIGVWSHSLRLAGWPDDRAVWTGSCPCQPFSAAGKQKGTADARHLWPAWFRLIRECRPGVVFGEQVSAAIRQGWLDLVSTDLEGIDYRIGSAVLGAHSVGAPHIRQRLYFVADSERRTTERHGLALAGAAGRMQSEVGAERLRVNTGDGFNADELGNAHHQGPQGRGLRGAVGSGDGASECAAGETGALDGLMADPNGGQPGNGDVQRSGEHGLVAQDGGVDWPPGSYGDESGHETGCKGDCGRHAICCGGSCCANPNKCDGNRCWLADDETGRRGEVDPVAGRGDEGDGAQRSERLVGSDRVGGSVEYAESEQVGVSRCTRIARSAGFWSACDWLPCIDGKARPVEPGTFPLVNGAPARVGRLRAYGNAIVAPCAEAFIEAYCDARLAVGLDLDFTKEKE